MNENAVPGGRLYRALRSGGRAHKDAYMRAAVGPVAQRRIPVCPIE